MRKSIWLFLIFLGFTVGGYIIYRSFFFTPAKQKPASNILSVDAFFPKSEDIQVSQSYIGQVEAINDAAIMPYINGYIADIIVKGGDHVKKGDVLLILRQEEYLAALASASADLYNAKADYLNAKIKYERMQKAGNKAVSPMDLDDAKTAYMSAMGTLEKSKANYFAAQTNYNYTYLTAPFEGIIGNIEPSIGDYVSPQGQILMHLVQYSPIKVVFSLSDKEYLDYLEKYPQQNFKIRVQLANGFMLSEVGKIAYAANRVDQQTNAVAMYAEFRNINHLLLPNAYVKIFLEQELKDVVLLEKSIVVMKPQGNFVYTVKDNIVQLHPLNVKTEYQEKMVVENNFAANELILATVGTPELLHKKVKVHKTKEL